MADEDWRVYPAIDLRRGRVVRLRQGNPDRETVYGTDAVDIASRWQEAGAEWVHIVNLDGALGEHNAENLRSLERIMGSLRGLKVQFGGGLRDLSTARRVVELGVSRVVFGTAAVTDPPLIRAALECFGSNRVAVGIDARDGVARTHGWRETGEIKALDLARRWAGRGVRWIIFTDVARDGMGQGVNLEASAKLAEVSCLNVIASGGVRDLEDVLRVHKAGLSGVIVGRALYEGNLILEEALDLPQG